MKGILGFPPYLYRIEEWIPFKISKWASSDHLIWYSVLILSQVVMCCCSFVAFKFQNPLFPKAPHPPPVVPVLPVYLLSPSHLLIFLFSAWFLCIFNIFSLFFLSLSLYFPDSPDHYSTEESVVFFLVNFLFAWGMTWGWRWKWWNGA